MPCFTRGITVIITITRSTYYRETPDKNPLHVTVISRLSSRPAASAQMYSRHHLRWQVSVQKQARLNRVGLTCQTPVTQTGPPRHLNHVIFPPVNRCDTSCLHQKTVKLNWFLIAQAFLHSLTALLFILINHALI